MPNKSIAFIAPFKGMAEQAEEVIRAHAYPATVRLGDLGAGVIMTLMDWRPDAVIGDTVSCRLMADFGWKNFHLVESSGHSIRDAFERAILSALPAASASTATRSSVG